MENKQGHDKHEWPNITRYEVWGEANAGAESDMIAITINAHLNIPIAGKETPELYAELKAMLMKDLEEHCKLDYFDPVPRNLPNEIGGYMLTRHTVVVESDRMDTVSITTYSERGASHWIMESEGPKVETFFGDKKL